MLLPPASPYLVPFEGSFDVRALPTAPPTGAPGRKTIRRQRDELTDRLRDLQRRLYAQDRFSVLLVFQAMDAAGKDGTIRAVMSGVDPAGCQVFSFKKPSSQELDHDFLWRTARCLPERGRIGIFNRSYYEEVLVVRVHPEYLNYQKLPRADRPDDLWEERFRVDSRARAAPGALRHGDRQVLPQRLAATSSGAASCRGSRSEEKRWKFIAGDVDEREHWGSYRSAFEAALMRPRGRGRPGTRFRPTTSPSCVSRWPRSSSRHSTAWSSTIRRATG